MARRTRRITGAALAISAAALLGAGLFAPTAALADVADHGGAARDDGEPAPGAGDGDGEENTDAAGVTGAGNTSGTLPWTGAEALPFLVVALLLVGIGGALVVLRRRGALLGS